MVRAGKRGRGPISRTPASKVVRVKGGYFSISPAARLTLMVPEPELLLALFVRPDPSVFAVPLTSFLSLLMPPNLSFAGAKVLLPVLVLIRARRHPPVREEGRR